MSHRRRGRSPLLVALLFLVAAASIAGCGGGDPKEEEAADGAGTAGDDLAVTVASYDLFKGRPTRFIAGLETVDRRLVTFGTVEMRFAFAGTGKGEPSEPPGAPVQARYLPVAGSEVPAPPPDSPAVVTASAARGVYAATTEFPRAGFWQVQVTAMVEGRARRGTGAFSVAESNRVPAPGDPAPAVENLTLAAPAELRPAVDSRAGSGAEVPDPELHRTTVAAALAAHRPAVVVISTPVYCTSRFCGPVTDVVDGLARSHGDRASFVHIEVWRDFQGRVINKAAADWVMRDGDLTEPWVFVVGADGRVTARFDNVVTRDELEPILAALPAVGPAS